MVALWRGEGEGRFSRDSTELFEGSGDVALADLNVDGEADVVRCTAEDGVVVRFGAEGATFSAAEVVLAEPCERVAVADFNEDGADELAVLPPWDPEHEDVVRVVISRR